uniref:Uncharacterized protein n=2 Tax=Emiliania huxleyi TaxID=2903 RepID=A0A0D3ILV2_EMIH1
PAAPAPSAGATGRAQGAGARTRRARESGGAGRLGVFGYHPLAPGARLRAARYLVCDASAFRPTPPLPAPGV